MLHLILTALLLAESPDGVDPGPIHEAKEALQEDLFNRVSHYMESNPETLDELMSQDYALSEGDVMLSSDRNAVGSLWPMVEIPYVISPALASRTADILAAMAMVSKHTCVSFHQRTSEPNYLLFKTSNGCSSYVGFIGGEQAVFTGRLCSVGNIVHEILHSLGFHHEHTRPDREQYITVLPRNIMAGMEKNFEIHRGKTFDLAYDISSIMHYGSGFFSSNGQPTIVPSKDVRNMGQRVKMTKMDIERVRRLYNCGDKQESQRESGGEAVLVSANKPEEGHTSTTASPYGSLQHLTAATRGHNTTTAAAASSTNTTAAAASSTNTTASSSREQA